MVHTGDVRVVLGNNAGDGRQLTRTVRQHHLHGHVAASRRQTALNHLQHQHRVNIAAGEHAHDRTQVAVLFLQLAVHQRRHGYRTGRLHHKLVTFHQEDQGASDIVFAHGRHIVHQLLDDGERHLTGAAHRNTISDGGNLLQRHQSIRSQRQRVRRRVLRLNTNNLDLLAELLLLRADSSGQTSQQTTTANTHNHGVNVRNLLQDLQTDGALTGNNVFIVEGVHEHRAGLFGVALRLRQSLIHGHAVQLNLSTVITGRSNLRQRRTQRHVNTSLNAQTVSRQSHTLSVVTRARRHDAALLLLLRKLRHTHVRTAHLEGTGTLQVLALEENL